MGIHLFKDMSLSVSMGLFQPDDDARSKRDVANAPPCGSCGVAIGGH